MGKISRTFALILTLIIVMSCLALLAVRPVSAQTTPKPSVPEFSVKLVAHPYDVPPTTTTNVDQYTGKETTITTPGYRVENKSIKILIRNQPFTAYADEEGNVMKLFYNFTFKGHFGEDWKTYYNEYINASTSDFTTISFPLQNEFVNLHEDITLDFKVEALIGCQKTAVSMTALGIGYTHYFEGISSGWSNIQTLTIPVSIVSPSPSVPEFSVLTVLPLLAAVPLVAVIVLKNKRLIPSRT